MKMKILLTGGGTAGSVTPLLALAKYFKEGDDKLLFVGTKTGPERKLVEGAQIEFKTIFSGKLRRYFSLRNFTDICRIKLGFFQSLIIILKFKPDVIVTAGSFVSVPLVWAGWLMRVKILVHQQDLQAGLANKLMAPFAAKVTKAFEETKIKGEWLGNPVRDLETKSDKIVTTSEKPVILFTGGGTGAVGINKLVSLALLEDFQVIHVTGKGKGINTALHKDYFTYEFLGLKMMNEAYDKADVVVSRAGLGTLSELATLGKAVIVIPMPDSHQEKNADYFKNKQAAIILNQKKLNPEKLTKIISNLYKDKQRMGALEGNISKIFKSNATSKIVEEVYKLKPSS